MKGSGIVLTGGPGVDVVVAVEGVSACSGGRRLVILTVAKEVFDVNDV